MKKCLLLALTLVVGSLLSIAAVPQDKLTAKRHLDPAQKVQLINGRSHAKSQGATAVRPSSSAATPLSKVSADGDVIASVEAQAFAFLFGPDGTQWYYTQTFEESGYYYTSSSITFYDSTHEAVGTVTVDVSDIANVNQIAVSADVTSTFYDDDSSTHEATLWYHTALNGVTSLVTQVYCIETGELLYEWDGSSIIIDTSTNNTGDYMRLMLINDTTVNKVVSGTVTSIDYTTVKMMRPAEDGETGPQLEHTFTIEADKTYYMNGSDINYWVLDGRMYYTIAQYKEDFISGIDYDSSAGTYELIMTEDNEFTVTVYDDEYNEVGGISVPIETADDAYLRMAAFGMMSDYDLSRNFFTSDGDFAYVIMWDDYITADDADRYLFEVYDADTTLVATVCDSVYNEYYTLKSIKGQEEQMMFMQIVDDGDTQQIAMVNIPSCETVCVLPAYIDDELITTELNRYKKEDSYQYVVQLAYATSDDDGNVIARLGWYDTNAQLDHYTSFNLGEYCEDFNPGLYDNMINPFIFDTDEQMEYIFLAKMSNDSTTTIDDYLYVGNEEGDIIFTAGPDSIKGDIITVYLLTEGVEQPEIVIAYIDETYDNYVVDFYPLPLAWFTTGGSGTKADPYQIATPGELVQVKTDTDAYYIVVDDIDMDEYPIGWSPISTFSGNIDGQGYSISNLSISGDEYYTGMFGYMTNGAALTNTVFIDPSLEISTESDYAGLIAGCAVGTTLEEIHVFGGEVSEPTGEVSLTAVGGLVGQASLYTTITSCSYEGDVTAAAATSVGGIVGLTRTTSTVKNASVTGSLTAGTGLGGIVGRAYSSSDVSDSHADVSLTAQAYIGGIMGENAGRVSVERCYAEGSIEATALPKWDGMSVGGIIGDLETDWSQYGDEEASIIVQGNIAAIDINITADDVEDDTSVHRIIGTSMINETWEDTETPQEELGLAYNYALSTMTITGVDVEVVDSAVSTDGQTIELSDVTEDFLTSLHYAFGEDSDSPWKGDSGLPVLYYEDVAAALMISAENIEVAVDESHDLTITIWGADAGTIDAECADTEIAELEYTEEGDGYIVVTVYGKAVGETTVTATSGSLTVVCNVTVDYPSGISNAVVDEGGISLRLTGNGITADGASTLSVYSLNGQRVNAASLPAGIYIVVATDSRGNKTTSKISVK